MELITAPGTAITAALAAQLKAEMSSVV